MEVFGVQAEEMRRTFGSDGGWPGLPPRFAGVVEGR
jgi:hypothetical protein